MVQEHCDTNESNLFSLLVQSTISTCKPNSEGKREIVYVIEGGSIIFETNSRGDDQELLRDFTEKKFILHHSLRNYEIYAMEANHKVTDFLAFKCENSSVSELLKAPDTLKKKILIPPDQGHQKWSKLQCV